MSSVSYYRNRKRGFTLTEVMVVIGVIVVLLAILLPALAAFRMQGIMGGSMSNLRKIASFMQIYANDNRDVIVPSQFDYEGEQFRHKGRVRSVVRPIDSGYLTGREHEGTWADILWVTNGLTLGLEDPEYEAYQYGAPDRYVYDRDSTYNGSPFRSMALNSRDYQTAQGVLGTGPIPYGTGASEVGLPGFFAANDFFNARPGPNKPVAGNWYSMGQISYPSRSMYLIDSFAGSVIAPEEEPFDNRPDAATGYRSIQVDFRYNTTALMLFLDGHVDPVSPWDELADLEASGVRVRDLDQRRSSQSD